MCTSQELNPDNGIYKNLTTAYGIGLRKNVQTTELNPDNGTTESSLIGRTPNTSIKT